MGPYVDAIWSFCGTTFFNHYVPRWHTPNHCWYAWILSLGTVSRYYPDTTLYTDDKGAEWLLEKLRLPFKSVVVNLDFLRDKNPQWWCYSKLKAYASHPRPFIHFDSDVFLWQKLPDRFDSAHVIAQSPEYLAEYYQLDLLDDTAKQVGGWLPVEYVSYRQTSIQRAINCGFMGGNNLAFIRHYANLGMEFIEANPQMWSLYKELYREGIVVEQYLLASCIHYYTQVNSRYGHVSIDLLFEKNMHELVFHKELTKQAGFTHIIGFSKGDKAIAERLENRVKRDYPILYDHVLQNASYLDNSITDTALFTL